MSERMRLREAGLKRCSRCKGIKLRDGGFYFRATGQIESTCKKCNRAITIARQQADPEKERARHKAWRDANTEKYLTWGRRNASTRRARVRGAFVEQVDPQVVFERDEGVCGFCGESVARDAFDVDHIVPLADGGLHSYDNARVAHPRCNRSHGRLAPLALTGR